MDRPSRVIAVGASALVLGTVVLSAGCKSMRNEVPPSKPYSTTGDPNTSSLFKSDPRPNNPMGMYPPNPAPGSPGDVNAGLGGANSPAQLGTPAPNSGPYVGGANNIPYSRGGIGGAGANQ